MSGRLPNFLILGAMKAGTTSLEQWIRAHPQAYMSPIKELFYFQEALNSNRGLDWYRAHFEGAGEAIAVGEATPTYLYSPVAPENIHRTLGDGVRLIATLRDPVDRAYSHYLHWREREVREKRSFAAAVEDELEGWAGELRTIHYAGDPSHVGYLDQGHYLPQLARYAERFGRESLLVVLVDDLESDPRGVYREICRHIGIDDEVVPDIVGTAQNTYRQFRPDWLFRFMVRNGIFKRMPKRVGMWLAHDVMTPQVKPRPPMDEELRRRLCEHFAGPNAALGAWLGRDLSHWSQP